MRIIQIKPSALIGWLSRGDTNHVVFAELNGTIVLSEAYTEAGDLLDHEVPASILKAAIAGAVRLASPAGLVTDIWEYDPPC